MNNISGKNYICYYYLQDQICNQFVEVYCRNCKLDICSRCSDKYHGSHTVYKNVKNKYNGIKHEINNEMKSDHNDNSQIDNLIQNTIENSNQNSYQIINKNTNKLQELYFNKQNQIMEQSEKKFSIINNLFTVCCDFLKILKSKLIEEKELLISICNFEYEKE